MRSKTYIRVFNIFLFLIVYTITGCTYLENRGRDFGEIFKGTVGAGFGLSVEGQVGPFRSVLGFSSYAEIGCIYGRWKNSFACHPHYDTNNTRGIIFYSDEGYHEHIGKRTGQPPRCCDKRLIFLPYEFKENPHWSNHEKSWLKHTAVEFGFTIIFVRMSIGVSFGEFLDFILGWFGIDIAGDDQGPRREWREEEDKKDQDNLYRRY